MYLTEDEAKQKWCPKVRQAYRATQEGIDYGLAAVNRGNYLEDDECLCIASQCMAWRTKHANGKRGYCGAFGKPDYD